MRRLLCTGAALAALLTLAPWAASAQTDDPASFGAMQWRNIGPFRGGRATTAVGVPSEPRVYYMGATGGGVWKTEDGGVHWRNVSDGFFATGSIGDIAVFARDPKILYVGTGEAPARGQMSSYGDGVYKSVDAGKTWTRVGLDKTRQISRVLIDPANPDIVYVAAQGSRWTPTDDRGVYKSIDGGKSWKRVLFSNPTSGASDLAIDPRDPKVLYAATWDFERKPWAIRSGGPGSAIWKSTDAGETWTKLSNGLPPLMGKIRLSVSPANPERIYAGIENAETGVFRSDDGGETWKQTSKSRGLAARPWYYMGVTADPKSADTVYYSGAELLKSTDGGATFKLITTPHSDQHTLWIKPNDPEAMINTDDGGASISFDGGHSWSTEDNQPTGQFYAAQADDRVPYWIFGGQQDSGGVSIMSRNLNGRGIGPKDWRSVGIGESSRFAFDPKDPRLVYASNFMAAVARLDMETGITRAVSIWPGSHLGDTAADEPERFEWSPPMAVSPFDPKVIYDGASVLLRSENEGNSWTKISPDLTRNDPAKHGRSGPFWHDGSGGEIYNTIYAITPSAHDRGTIWIGTDDGLVQLTRDGGKSWKNVTPDGWGEGWAYTIDISAHDPGTAYVAFSRIRFDDYTPHIFRTTDYGKTWTDLAGTLPQDQPARVVREDPKRKGLLYAATEYALWISFDDGAHWRPFQQNMPRVPISDLQVHGDDLIASTDGRAFWILDDLEPLRQMTPQTEQAKLFLFRTPSPLRIASGGGGGSPRAPTSEGVNAPNGAIVRYSLAQDLPASEPLKLEILDAQGKVVRTVTSAAPAKAETAKPEPDKSEPGKPERGKPAAAPLPAKRGLHQYVWDLRSDPPVGAPAGLLQPTGRYTVRLTAGSDVASSGSIEVLPDPRTSTTPQEQQAHVALARELLDQAADIGRLLGEVRKAQTALAATNPARAAELEKLVNEISPFSPNGPLPPGDQDPLTTGMGILSETQSLEGQVDAGAGPVTQGERERAEELKKQWQELKPRVEAALRAGKAQ